ncbi:Methyltransferase domain protein [uncultured archaeon]|nr:Methyltransferase domain protein [uncultured archaeon]
MNKLNFGCGEDIKEGFDNIDVQINPKIQKSFNFDKFPYPIKENSYDYIWSRSVLEHLEEPDKVLNELWRICKPNAVIEMIVPYYNNKSAVSDMQHKHFFSDTTFKVFVDETCRINKEKKFKIKKLELVPTVIGKFMPKFLREKLSLFFGGIISYVHVELIVKKD